MFCMFPDSKSEWKKWTTGQSFIRKEITTYRIGTLGSWFILDINRNLTDSTSLLSVYSLTKPILKWEIKNPRDQFEIYLLLKTLTID